MIAHPYRSASTKERVAWGRGGRAATTSGRPTAAPRTPSSAHPRRPQAKLPCTVVPVSPVRRAPALRARKALGIHAPCTETPTPVIHTAGGHIPTHKRVQRAGPLRGPARKAGLLTAPDSVAPLAEATRTPPRVTTQAADAACAPDAWAVLCAGAAVPAASSRAPLGSPCCSVRAGSP